MGALVRAMTMADYDDAIALWQACEGLGLSERVGWTQRVELRVCSRSLGARA